MADTAGIYRLVAVFSFDLLQIKGEVPLSLEVYDLSGRLRRVIYEGQQ